MKEFERYLDDIGYDVELDIELASDLAIKYRQVRDAFVEHNVDAENLAIIDELYARLMRAASERRKGREVTGDEWRVIFDLIVTLDVLTKQEKLS